jgi:hypothetical protein
MAANRDTNRDIGGVTPGTGTKGNREAQKVDTGKGTDTTTPGVPNPQPGGPSQPEGAPTSVGVGPGKKT